MVLQYSLVAFFLAPLSTAIRFQGRGSANHTAASYSNSTTKVKSLKSTTATASQTSSIVPSSYYNYVAKTALPSGYVNPRPTDTGPAPIDSYDATLHNYTRTSNASCTVHIPDASIEWWHPATYTHPLATITSVWGNYSNAKSYTFLLHTTSFDAVSALQTEEVCISGWTTFTEWNWTAWECIPYTEKPIAASTAVVYRTAVPPIPSGREIAMSEVWNYDIILNDLPSMTISISVGPNATTVGTMPTPFVHFTAYEVEHGNSTKTVELSSVYVQSYWRKGIEHDVTATGPVPGGFMDQIPQSACYVGILQAVVTVIIFVEMFYINQPTFAPGIVHWESSALGWDDEAPLGVMDQTLTSIQSHIMTDWNLSGTMTEPVGPRTTEQQNPAPTVKPGVVSDPRKETKPAQVQTVGTVGTAPAVVGPSSVVVEGSQTLRPGGPAVTVSGTPVALAPSATAIVAKGTSLPLLHNQKPGQQQTVGTFGTIPVVVGPSLVVVVGTQTLQPGGAPITLGPGTTVSLAPSATALVIGGTTSILPQIVNVAPQAAAPPVLTIGPTTFVPNAATQFFIGPGQTLTPGGTAVIDGTKVSLDSSAAFIVIGSSTQILLSSGSASVQVNNVQPELVFGDSTFTALPTSSRSEGSPGNCPSDPKKSQQQNQNSQINQDGSGPTFVISGQTLAPGGAPITVSGSTLSLAPSGSFLVIDGSTTSLVIPAVVAAAHITPPPLTIGNGVFRPLTGIGTTYQIGTALLTPGGSIVVAGTTISLAPGATALVVNGVTTTLSAQAQPIITNPPLLAIGSQMYTATPGTGTTFVIGGHTLTPGGTITVDGTTIVLSPQATELVYGSSGRSTSTALFPATTTRGTRTASSASASERQSGGGQAAPTSSREGRAWRPGSSISAPLGVVGCLGWLLV
ncbi:hypothetical protein BU25DRAFT_167203 [Macroventuria anomochaeta]|uniref:Uncharacterized protein n=1 Tax=Macroventuria anomochaeta TaxID=301207 RepID=A0ACB6RSB2_9PLEO|nr:uncharacterized protein BU25DRAFT_167203 [Macroventuria anomochaeta]KAF2623814.1 hypothetical protein BU25DRAFT_167203 [Macroventuria anomochaeta]